LFPFSCHSKHNQSSSDDGDEKESVQRSIERAMSLLRIHSLSQLHFSFNRRTKHRLSSNGAILASSFPVARECCPGESPLLHIAFVRIHGGASFLLASPNAL
jgi:hypothetical protein